MIIGTRYTDSMDSSRTVVPCKEDGTCRVYFDGAYVGKAKVPVRLFSSDWVGFHTAQDANDTYEEADDQVAEKPHRWEGLSIGGR